ncbi:MAG: SDR family oxidoreductase, partial [Parvularcula sp.]|nr:SDR family oxidoreductase [Parvularcula sp.]
RNDGRAVSIATIKGDITSADLGLTAEIVASAGPWDLVIHCAAVTDFTEESEKHRAVNVEGTKNVIDFAECHGSALLHVSTAYVCGEREGTIFEDELDCGQTFSNGYEATKARAEALVREGRVPFVIARPSIVLGDSETGATRSFDTIYPVLKVLAEGLVTRMPVKPDATLNLVPIDHVTSGICELAERFESAKGYAYHLVAEEATPLSAFPTTLSKFDGLSVPEWVGAEAFSLNDLNPLERRFFERGAAVYASYFTRAPRFDDRRYRHLTGQSSAVTGPEWWEKLVSYALERGFIKRRGLGRRQA